ncbi:hypothetical protein V8F06_006163 [Rhypophila decipiens]
MSLLALNHDVKCLILDRLNQPDLYTLCLTNVQLYQNAQPTLYSSIRLGDGRCRIFYLLRTLLSKPELAAYIRSLSITLKSEPVLPRNPQLPDPDVDFICDFVQDTGVRDAHAWARGLRKGRAEAYLAVLLLNLPSCRILNIATGIWEFPGRNYLGLALRLLRGDMVHTGSLQNLQQMGCLVDVREHLAPAVSHHSANLLDLLYLPALKSLSTQMYIDPVLEFPWPDPTPLCAARLEFLKIVHLHELHLGPILSSTPNIQKLHWNRGRGEKVRTPEISAFFPPGPWASINLKLVSVALGQVKKTLKELRIWEYDSFKPRSNDLPQFQGPLRSLSLVEFETITVLEIPIRFVMEHSSRTIQTNHFPPNLQILTLSTNYTRLQSADEAMYFNAVSRWFEADGRRETPYLKKLTFVVTVRERQLRQGSREALRRLRVLSLHMITIPIGTGSSCPPT